MRKKLNKRYCEIRDLDALELERDRLAYKIGLREQALERHLEDVKESLTLSNIWRMVWNRIDGPTLAVGWSQGYNLFSSIFRRKRKKHTCSF